MIYYPHPFTMEQVDAWIAWNLENYKKYNHGLWAVILKHNNTFLGDCGITLQEVDGETLPELGYHIHKQYWNNGYATEAAGACITHAFTTLKLDRIYSYTEKNNLPSIRVAQKNGMKFVKQFKKVVMGTLVDEVLYCIERHNDK